MLLDIMEDSCFIYFLYCGDARLRCITSISHGFPAHMNSTSVWFAVHPFLQYTAMYYSVAVGLRNVSYMWGGVLSITGQSWV